jgi:hypothetical protein
MPMSINPMLAEEDDVDLDLAFEIAVKAAKGAGELIRQTFRT